MIRISGQDVLALIQGFFRNRRGETPRLEPQKACYGFLYDDTSMLDEVVLLYFAAPHSYTGEEMIEISCHASPYIVNRTIQILVDKGARVAEPGEFTFRSYLNGKRDMTEAEAVTDIIAAESKAQLAAALAQLRGELSKRLQKIRKDLVRFSALLELELDFSEEDVEFANREELIDYCTKLNVELTNLIDSYRTGRKVRNGIQTVLAGVPNSGKSSLLNRLLGEDRAIVSDLAGTTRDAVTETVIVGGILFRFVDTAGIRKTEDPIEKLGVKKSLQYLQESDVRLLLIDPTVFDEINLQEQLSLIPQTLGQKGKIVYLINKIDLLDPNRLKATMEVVFEATGENPLTLSAKKGEGISALRRRLLKISGCNSFNPQSVITNVRHLRLLEVARDALSYVLQGLERGLSTDLLTSDLKQAISSLGEITGDTITGEEVLRHIFSHFCIGK